MGNSEVGHLNLGAGRPVLQDLPRIDAAIADGSFFERPALLEACRGRRRADGTPPPHQPHRSGRRPRQRPAPRRARRAGRRAGRPGRPRPRAARRPGHAAVVGARLRRRPRAAPRRGPPGRPDRVGRWPLLRDGPRPSLGPGRARLRRDRPRGGGAGRRTPPPRSRPPTRAARTTSSCRRRSSTASTAIVRSGDPVIHANFRADRARQLTHALVDAGRSTASTGPRRTAGRPRPTCSS